MTTNFQNPVDGDLQALIEHIKEVLQEYEEHGGIGYGESVYRTALAALTAPPAQLLRPVDLSKCKKLWYDHDDLSAEIVCIPLKEIKKALRQQGYEVQE